LSGRVLNKYSNISGRVSNKLSRVSCKSERVSAAPREGFNISGKVSNTPGRVSSYQDAFQIFQEVSQTARKDL
jgi:hypothetical protein